MNMSDRFRFVFPLLNGSTSDGFRSYLLVHGLTSSFCENISSEILFINLSGRFRFCRFIIWAGALGFGSGKGGGLRPGSGSCDLGLLRCWGFSGAGLI